ncbi:hypothetical protein BKA70DRAFT_1226460 [Coprinopsis sp. MPI-PUGE-AT-0042]|nr:hypothetical protein BKA70DRAFT_1226460 [Coprinopsis sp. MPI-PUGE-AT-0042]
MDLRAWILALAPHGVCKAEELEELQVRWLPPLRYMDKHLANWNEAQRSAQLERLRGILDILAESPMLMKISPYPYSPNLGNSELEVKKQRFSLTIELQRGTSLSLGPREGSRCFSPSLTTQLAHATALQSIVPLIPNATNVCCGSSAYSAFLTEGSSTNFTTSSNRLPRDVTLAHGSPRQACYTAAAVQLADENHFHRQLGLLRQAVLEIKEASSHATDAAGCIARMFTIVFHERCMNGDDWKRSIRLSLVFQRGFLSFKDRAPEIRLIFQIAR